MQPLDFVQRSELGGVALVNATERTVRAHLEIDAVDGAVHLTSVDVPPRGHVALPRGRAYKLVHSQTKKALLSFEAWYFEMVAHSKEGEFLVKYVFGPPVADLVAEFVPARMSGSRVTYGTPEPVEAPAEIVAGRTYSFPVARAHVAGKLVIGTRDGRYQSMIPWSKPALSNPLYLLTQLVAPVAAQSAIVKAVEAASGRQGGSAVAQTLLASLVSMHGPMLLSEWSRDMSAQSAVALPRPGDQTPMDAWKRVLNNGEMWKRVLASAMGGAVMSKMK